MMPILQLGKAEAKREWDLPKDSQQRLDSDWGSAAVALCLFNALLHQLSREQVSSLLVSSLPETSLQGQAEKQPQQQQEKQPTPHTPLETEYLFNHRNPKQNRLKKKAPKVYNSSKPFWQTHILQARPMNSGWAPGRAQAVVTFRGVAFTQVGRKPQARLSRPNNNLQLGASSNQAKGDWCHHLKGPAPGGCPLHPNGKEVLSKT